MMKTISSQLADMRKLSKDILALKAALNCEQRKMLFDSLSHFADYVETALVPGTKVQIIEMQDPYPVPSGTVGTVVDTDDITIKVQWENGSGLGLDPFVDKFRIISVKNSN